MLPRRNIKSHSGKKVCFYIGLSNSYGELFDAWYFMYKSFSEGVFMVPSDIFLENKGSLLLDSGRARLIEIPEIDCLEEVISGLNPDVLVLASGYQMDPDVISEIIKLSDKNGMLLCTTDPFNGLWADILGSNDEHLHKKLCKEQVKVTRDRCIRLKDVVHIYALPINNHSYFNRNAVQSEISFVARLKRVIFGAEKPSILFVINSVDYEINSDHYREHGGDFSKFIYGKLIEVSSLGFMPKAVFPENLIREIKSYSDTDWDLVSSCSFDKYMHLIREAEYCFLWNAASASMLYRCINRKPTFTFNKGHMLSLFKSLEGKYKSIDFHPTMVKPKERITDELLSRKTVEFNFHADLAFKALDCLPQPSCVIDGVLKSGK